jgi:hypothetical protein
MRADAWGHERSQERRLFPSCGGVRAPVHRRGMKRSKLDENLEASATAHAEDAERAEAIHRARRFKSSWVELAEALTSVRKSGRWKVWGYATFDDYAKGELHLRQETVDKLTGSFLFLQKRAPEVLERDGVRAPIPSYDAVDFLRRAESQDGASKEAVDEIRRRVIDEGAQLPSLAKKFKDQVFPMDDVARRARDTAALRNVATRLRDLLAETHVVPKKLAGEASSALERLLEAIALDEEKAA